MVSTVDLLQLVTDELITVATDHTSVSTPEDHVDVFNRTSDIITPFFGFEWQRVPVSYGFGGNTRIVGENISNDTIDSVDRVRDYQLTVDLGAVVDGDYPRRRDEFVGHIDDQFIDFVDGTRTLHADVSDVHDEGTSPSGGGDDRDVGFRTTYAIDYMVRDTVDVPAAETIEWGVDADSTDAYPENY